MNFLTGSGNKFNSEQMLPNLISTTTFVQPQSLPQLFPVVLLINFANLKPLKTRINFLLIFIQDIVINSVVNRC